MRLPQRFEELYLVFCGVLFFAIGILDFLAGPPPATGPEILKWLESSKIYISFSIELLFFAIVFMLPGIHSLDIFLTRHNENSYSFGCAVIKIVIPIWAVLLIIQGRLVFPIFGINLSPSNAELALTFWYGGLHAVYELMAGATVLVSLNLGKLKFGKPFVIFGLVTSAFEFAGAYPWIVGPKVMLMSQTLFSVWFIVVGIMLYRIKQQADYSGSTK